MKKINFNELKSAGIMGGVASDIKAGVSSKTPETKVSTSTGAEVHDEMTGERETIVKGGGGALKSPDVQRALKEASEKPFMGK